MGNFARRARLSVVANSPAVDSNKKSCPYPPDSPASFPCSVSIFEQAGCSIRIQSARGGRGSRPR
jgi:hypothetical protein